MFNFGLQDEELLDEDVPVTFDRTTTKISVFDGSDRSDGSDGSPEIGAIEEVVSTDEARRDVRRSLDRPGKGLFTRAVK